MEVYSDTFFDTTDLVAMTMRKKQLTCPAHMSGHLGLQVKTLHGAEAVVQLYEPPRCQVEKKAIGGRHARMQVGNH